MLYWWRGVTAIGCASCSSSCLPSIALQVTDVGGGALLVLAASADGSVSRLRMQVPTQPGAQPEEIQVRACLVHQGFISC